MKSTELRQLIRESINEYIRDIDEAGTKAGLQAKIEATEGAIAKREKMANMEGIDEAYHEMLDKSKMKEIGNEVKALKKSLDKLKKQLDKLNSKSTKSEKSESEDKEIVDEVNIDETFPESGSQLEENMGDYNSMSDQDLMMYAEQEGMEDMVVLDGEGGLANREEIISALSEGNDLPPAPSYEETDANQVYEFLHMQKLAGIITEAQYNVKVEEARKSTKK